MKRSNFLNKCLLFLITVFIFCVTSYSAFKIVQYKAYIWMPDYFFRSHSNDFEKMNNGHVLFMIADHHEPSGRGLKGAENSKLWCDNFKKTFESIKDDFGNNLQWSWFYPYDHKNKLVIYNLNELVYDGWGEIEFQWHHGSDTNETLPPKLVDAIAWFNHLGCMLSTGKNPKFNFGFVHGNWSLDNSRENNKWCGVTRELDILKKNGCYADFTFATFGTKAQPSKINSIYYAKDTDESKSYNNGIDARVGLKNNDFLIFQGPISFDWHNFEFDCAALETTSPPQKHRIKNWLKRAPIVKGRPEWVFLKAYSHAFQSQNEVISEQFRKMLFELKRFCKEKKLLLHFVTAREAYNIVKAAEAGYNDNPELYRDFLIKKPINRVVLVPCRVDKITVDLNKIEFELIEPQNKRFFFKLGPLNEVNGFMSKFQYKRINEKNILNIYGKGVIEINSKEKILFNNQIILNTINSHGEYLYKVNAIIQ